MTRSLSCAVHGLFAESWAYHPFGLPVLGLFIYTIVQAIAPRSYRERVALRMHLAPALWNGFYLGFVTLFVSYGATRTLSAFVARFY